MYGNSILSMNEPDWARVLSYLYEEQEEITYLLGLDESNDIVQKTGMEPKKIEETLEHMNNIGLVDDSYPPISGEKNLTMVKFSLSEKGFDVAHNREMNDRQRSTNQVLTVLTIFVAIGSVLQGYSAYLSHEEPMEQIALLGAIMLVLVLIALIVPLIRGYNVSEYYSRFFWP